jgi:hypothetical protein
VERVDRLPLSRLRVDVPQFALGLFGHLGGILLVRRRRVRWLRLEMFSLRHVRLQLVVSLGCGLLLAMRSQPRRMASRVWVEMPIVASATATERPKYSFEGNALAFYHGNRAYVSFEDERAPDELAHYSDVRVLTDSEGRELEKGLPFPMVPTVVPRRGIGLGDAISWLTGRIGIDECAGCRRRKSQLNRVSIWGWWTRGRALRFRSRLSSGRRSRMSPERR